MCCLPLPHPYSAEVAASQTSWKAGLKPPWPYATALVEGCWRNFGGAATASKRCFSWLTTIRKAVSGFLPICQLHGDPANFWKVQWARDHSAKTSNPLIPRPLQLMSSRPGLLHKQHGNVPAESGGLSHWRYPLLLLPLLLLLLLLLRGGGSGGACDCSCVVFARPILFAALAAWLGFYAVYSACCVAASLSCLQHLLRGFALLFTALAVWLSV